MSGLYIVQAKASAGRRDATCFLLPSCGHFFSLFRLFVNYRRTTHSLLENHHNMDDIHFFQYCSTTPPYRDEHIYSLFTNLLVLMRGKAMYPSPAFVPSQHLPIEDWIMTIRNAAPRRLSSGGEGGLLLMTSRFLFYVTGIKPCFDN